MIEKVICLSGGADPCHIGHLKMIDEASKHGKVIWILNSDNWLKRKKGFVFMKWSQRAEILLGFKNVYDVVEVDDTDGTVCEALMRIKPDYFGNGGDRTSKNTPEMEVCDHLGIELLWGLGGDKVESSSELVNNAIEQLRKSREEEK